MLALPCRRRCGSVDWDGGGAEGASATGSEELPLTVSPAACGGGGGERSMPATDLVAFGGSRRRTRGGDRRRGNPRLLRASEMRLKTSRGDWGGGGSLCRGGWQGGIPWCRQCPGGPRGGGGGGPAPGCRPHLLAGVRRDLLPPHPLAVGPLPPGPPG